MKRMNPYPKTLVATLILSAALAAGVLTGCGGSDDGGSSTLTPEQAQALAEAEARANAPRQNFAGTVDGTDAYVGVIAYGAELTAYVCDGVEIAKWFDGELDGVNLSLTAKDGSTLDGTILDGTLEGIVTLADGTTGQFSAPAAHFPAGLWQLATETLRVGWVVLADGSQRGAGTGEGGIKKTLPVNTGTGTAGSDLNNAPAAPPSAPPADPVPDRLRKKCRAIQQRWLSNQNKEQTLDVMLHSQLEVEDWADTGCDGRFGSIGGAQV